MNGPDENLGPAQILDDAGQITSRGRAIFITRSDLFSFYPGDSASDAEILAVRTLLVLNTGERIPIIRGRLSSASTGEVHYFFARKR